MRRHSDPAPQAPSRGTATRPAADLNDSESSRLIRAADTWGCVEDAQRALLGRRQPPPRPDRVPEVALQPRYRDSPELRSTVHLPVVAPAPLAQRPPAPLDQIQRRLHRVRIGLRLLSSLS